MVENVNCNLFDNVVVPIPVEDHYDGTYTVLMPAKVAGRHTIQIRIGLDHVSSSPYHVIIDPGDICVSKCYVTDVPEVSKVGVEGSFLIQCTDKFSNKLSNSESIDLLKWRFQYNSLQKAQTDSFRFKVSMKTFIKIDENRNEQQWYLYSLLFEYNQWNWNCCCFLRGRRD
jgi:hypothetical protein